MIDVSHHLGAIVREVSRREHEGRLARVVVATRSYDTDQEDLWDALTSAERIPRWFLPVSGDLRLGGRYQLEGNAGGEILQCEPPRLLSVTWEYGGEASWVTVTLQPEPNERSRLTLEHVAHVPDDFWEQYGPGAVGVGWDLALMGLALHLQSEASADRQEVEAWSASDEGKGYMRAASDAWCEAVIRDGADAAWARAAAARTSAFYTGEPPSET